MVRTQFVTQGGYFFVCVPAVYSLVHTLAKYFATENNLLLDKFRLVPLIWAYTPEVAAGWSELTFCHGNITDHNVLSQTILFSQTAV
jgi:hypothetical protein